MTRYLLTGLLFLLPTLVVLAQDTDTNADVKKPKEMLYVTDQLRLSLYPQPNDKSKRLEYLDSGDRLGILEVKGPYALVITPEGRQGWVKRGFLLPQPTSKLLLAAEKKTNKTLLREIERLANSKIVIDQYELDMDELTKKLKAAEAAREKAEHKATQIEQASRDRAELEAAIELAKKSNTTMPVQALIDTALAFWQYLVPILLLFMLFGSLIAKLMIDARIKKRFHGLKLW